MITIQSNANTRTTTALSITVGCRASYYHVNNSERVNVTNIKLAKNNSLTDLTVSAKSLQEFLNTGGRAYKKEAHDLSLLLFGLGYDQFKSEVAALKAAKSRKQVADIIEDVIYTLCAAYIIKSTDDKYTAVADEPKSIPELIRSISEGSEPEITGKQARQLTEIAERKLRKGDTTANWETVRVYALLNN